MKLLNLLFTILTTLSSTILLGQEKIAGIYIDSTGQVFIQEKLPAYFFIEPLANSTEKILVPSTDPKSNPMYFDGNGVHYIRVYDSQSKEAINYRIFADGLAPKISLEFKQGLIMNSSYRYYADKGSSAILIGKDILSGVDKIYFSLNNDKFKPFSEKIVFNEDSDYHLKVFAIDNVGNVSDTMLFRVITAVNSVVQMNNIYFDSGSANLRPESRKELNELVDALNQFPEIRIEIRAHTDSRGEESFNQQLSELRSKSVVNFLVTKGINSNRLSSKGFGESQPVNGCVKGVKCTEEELQANRRVEFQVLPLK